MFSGKPKYFSSSRQSSSPYVSIPAHLKGVLIGISLVLLVVKNPFLSICSVLVFPILAQLTWRKGEPPIFFFGLAFQWLNMAMVVYRANIMFKHVNEIYGSETESAFWLTLIGLLIIALGIRLTLSKGQIAPEIIISRDADKYSPHKLFLGYVFFNGVIVLLNSLTDAIWSMRSILLSIAALKWLFFFILSYIGIKYKKQNLYFYGAFVCECVLGFGSYFSDFKMPFMIVFMVLITIGYRLPMRYLIGIIIICATVFHLAVIWTAVKPSYRNFLNQGSGEQIIKVNTQERLKKFYQLYSELNKERYHHAIFELIDRVSVNGNFATVLKRVPGIIPHADGERIFFALKHIATPRIFFPHKPVVDDSLVTMRYTDAHINKNTSIGVGYIAESYIDFGIPKMFIPIFIFGLIIGWMHNSIIRGAKDKFLGNIVAVVVLMNLWQYELGWAKLLGGITMNFLIMSVMLRCGGRFFSVFYQPKLKVIF